MSTGEVFDRISKRMVVFADVEEVFRRITSEGGIFFQMQEKQADTLKGQVSNLRDAIDIMLNEIGSEHDSILKGVVSSMRTLIENWREVEWYLVRIIPLFGAWKVRILAMSLANANFAKSFLNIGGKLIDFATKLGLSSKAADMLTTKLLGLSKIKMVGIIGLLSGVALAIFEIVRRSTQASRELKRLNKELEKLLSEDKTNLDKQVKSFENLVNRLQLVNKGSKEHKDIIDSLNHNYGEYLGFIVKETTTYEQLANNINNVTKALTNKAKMSSYEKTYGKVLEKTTEQIDEYQKTLRSILKNPTAERELKKNGISIIPTDKEIDDIFFHFEEKVRKAKKDTPFAEIVLETFKDYGISVTTTTAHLGSWVDYAKTIITQKDEELKLQERINSIYGQGIALTADHRRELEKINKEHKDEFANAKTAREQDEVNRKYDIKRLRLEGKFQGLGDAEINANIKALEKRTDTMLDVNNKIAKNAKELGQAYADMIYISNSKAEGKSISEIAKEAASSWKDAQETIEEQNALKKAGTKYNEDTLENAKKTAKAYEYLLKLLGREDLLVHKKDAVATKLRNQINLIKEMNKEYEKLVKIMPKEEAQAQVRKSYEPTAKALDLDISKNIFTNKGTEEALNSLFAKFPQRLHTEIKKAMDNFTVEIGVETKTKSLESLKKEVEEYFARFDMSKSIEEMGISSEFAQKYFGFEYMDLDALSRTIASKTLEMKKFGEEGEKVAKQTTEKLTTIERKAQEERLKTYLQYARNSIGERAKIKLEELRKLAEIERTFTKDDQKNEKKAAQKAVKEESYQATQKLEWEEFQKTDTFINLFKDLDFASQKLIDHTIQKLNEFKDQWKDMPLEDMRSIVSKINELEGALVSINPFQSAKGLKAGGAGKKGNVEALQTEAIDIEQKLLTNEQEIALYEEYLRLKQEGKEIEAAVFAVENNRVDLLDETNSSLDYEITKRKTISNNLEKDLVSVNTKLIKEKQLAKSYQDQADAISKTQKMADDLIEVFAELAEVLGADSDGIGMTFVNMGKSMMDTVLNTIMLQAQLNAAAIAAKGLGYAMNTAMGIVGWIVMAIQLIVEALSAIFKAKDKSLVNQIDALAKSAEKTQEAFDELANSIDSIYSTDALAETNKEMEELNKKLLDNLKAQKALQEQRKQTDEVVEEIEALDKAIIEAEKELVEAQQGVFSHATDGILDSAIDAARNFVDAWADAYAETGNGLKGLEENFEEMFLNMAKQQAALQIVGVFVERWKRDLEKYINTDDLELTKEEAQSWAEEVRQTFPELNAALEGYLGTIIDSVGGGSLSGLEAEIGAMSEETAQILAAYLNSIRFYVAENNTVIKQLRDYIVGNDDQVNPMLAQLRIIAQQTSSIRTLLDSVVKAGHPDGDSGIRVFIN